MFSTRTKDSSRMFSECSIEFYTIFIDGLISEKIRSKDCAPLNLDGPLDMDAMLRLLNFLNVEVNGDQLFSEICDLN
jgi:hypothetical protein